MGIKDAAGEHPRPLHRLSGRQRQQRGGVEEAVGDGRIIRRALALFQVAHATLSERAIAHRCGRRVPVCSIGYELRDRECVLYDGRSNCRAACLRGRACSRGSPVRSARPQPCRPLLVPRERQARDVPLSPAPSAPRRRAGSWAPLLTHLFALITD